MKFLKPLGVTLLFVTTFSVSVLIVAMSWSNISILDMLGISTTPRSIITAVNDEAERQLEAKITTGEWADDQLPKEIPGAEDSCVFSDNANYFIIIKHSQGEHVATLGNYKESGWSVGSQEIDDNSRDSILLQACKGEDIVPVEMGQRDDYPLEGWDEVIFRMLGIEHLIDESDKGPKM